MRVDRGRTKKLAVAFHFQMSDPAAWKCDVCRQQRLDQTRRCAFLPVESLGPSRTVWARGRASTTQCPKSIITAESLAMLEAFAAWRVLGPNPVWPLPAKIADALFVLQNEWRSLQSDAEQSH